MLDYLCNILKCTPLQRAFSSPVGGKTTLTWKPLFSPNKTKPFWLCSCLTAESLELFIESSSGSSTSIRDFLSETVINIADSFCFSHDAIGFVSGSQSVTTWPALSTV